jgi:hypothetical protein
VYRLGLVAIALLDEPRPFHQRAEVVQGNAAIYLQERALNDVFKLGRVQRTRAREGKQMPPRLRGEPTPLVRAQHAKSHIHSSLTRDRTESKKGRIRDASGIDPLPLESGDSQPFDQFDRVPTYPDGNV